MVQIQHCYIHDTVYTHPDGYRARITRSLDKDKKCRISNVYIQKLDEEGKNQGPELRIVMNLFHEEPDNVTMHLSEAELFLINQGFEGTPVSPAGA